MYGYNNVDEALAPRQASSAAVADQGLFESWVKECDGEDPADVFCEVFQNARPGASDELWGCPEA